MKRALLLLISAPFMCVLTACADSTAVQSVTGTYQATVPSLAGAVTADVLAEGGSLSLTLSEGGTVAGQLDIPGSIPEGPFQADMAGTYSVSGDTVRLTQAADTFVRDIRWIIGPDRLSGSGTFSGVTVNVVLDRT